MEGGEEEEEEGEGEEGEEGLVLALVGVVMQAEVDEAAASASKWMLSIEGGMETSPRAVRRGAGRPRSRSCCCCCCFCSCSSASVPASASTGRSRLFDLFNSCSFSCSRRCCASSC